MTNKTSIYAVLVTALFAAIIAKVRTALDSRVPVGYQDENGFHFGVEPISESNEWR